MKKIIIIVALVFIAFGQVIYTTNVLGETGCGGLCGGTCDRMCGNYPELFGECISVNITNYDPCMAIIECENGGPWEAQICYPE